MWLKKTLTWVEDKWARFEAWVASWMPGLKTKVVAGLGVVGTVASQLQEYITGLPLSEFMNGTQIAIATGLLFTLTFWFRGLGDRVSARVSGSNT